MKDETASPQGPVADAPAAPSGSPGRYQTFIDKAVTEILPVTFWFEPAADRPMQPLSVRIVGHRLDIDGKPQSGDRVAWAEEVDGAVVGAGPIAVTAQITGVNPGNGRSPQNF